MNFKEWLLKNDESFLGKVGAGLKGLAKGALDIAVGPDTGIDPNHLQATIQGLSPIMSDFIAGNSDYKRVGARKVRSPLLQPSPMIRGRKNI